MQTELRPHPARHVSLRFRSNHAILYRQQKPRWLGFPRGHRSLLLNALHRDRPLHGAENRCLAGGSLVSDSARKTPFGHPDEAMRIGLQLRRLGMRLGTIKNIRDSFTLRGRKSRNVDQAPYAVILWTGDHRTA